MQVNLNHKPPENALIVIVGSGFGGLSVAYALKKSGIHDFILFERHDQVGGVWSRNTYPGVACDVPSHLYSFSHFLNPNWSSEFADGREILQYLVDFCRRHDIERHIRFNTAVTAATFNRAGGTWTVTSAAGSVTAKYFIAAVGQSSEPLIPPIPGLHDFEGNLFHSAKWDSHCTLAGKTVSVIGNAASASQFIPIIAKIVKKLHVFQRTPNWVIPKMNHEFSEEEKHEFRSSPAALADKRGAIVQFTEILYQFLLYSEHQQTQEARTRESMEAQIKDPELQKKLIPNYPAGTKRLVLSDDFLPVFERDNVELIVDKIERIEKRGILDVTGTLRESDVIICATGFQATRYLISTIKVTGRADLDLQTLWRGGLNTEAFFGTFVHGFPNLFTVFGPNTGLGASSVVLMIEAQSDLIVKSIKYVEASGLKSIEVDKSVQTEFNREIQAALTKLVWTSDKVHSWFKTSEGKVTTKWPYLASEFERRTGELQIANGTFIFEAP